MSNFSSGGFYHKSEETRLLDAIRYILTLIKDTSKAENILNIPGGSVTNTYYTGVAAGNPSGSTANIHTKEFSFASSVLFTQTFTYNAANNILSITTS